MYIKKDELGFDSSYGIEQLSKICVEHNDIDSNDTNFIIEASYINPELISKKVFDAKIKTGEVYYRASRGSEPNIDYGIDYLSNLVSKFGASVYGGTETFIEDKEKLTLDVSVNKINSIIGQEIPKIEIEKILICNTWNFSNRDEEYIRITHRKYCRYYLFDSLCKPRRQCG